MDAAEISQALDTIWQRVRRLNRYVEERAPWQLVKAEAQDELDAVLCSLAEGLRIVTLLLAPFLPAATTKLLSSMNVADHSLTCAGWDAPGLVRSATPIKPISALFPKVDQPPNSAPA
jgi:methionyl-tRNA synthetase